MKKKDLEQKLLEVDQKLQALGDLTTLMQGFSTQKQTADAFIAEIQAKKPDIDAIPTQKQNIDKLLVEVERLKAESKVQLTSNQEATVAIDAVKTKAEEIQKLSLDQLGVISNEKLSNSFEKVVVEMKQKNKEWFWWLLGTSGVLLLAIGGVVVWQTLKGGTIFEINFLVKLALTSPIIFFDFFVNRQYSRTQRLIEEYQFKASIARSLEAYKEIIVGLFADQVGDEFKKKLDFILEAIGKVYSSPMDNIRNNDSKETAINKTAAQVSSNIKEIVSDVTSVVPKVKP